MANAHQSLMIYVFLFYLLVTVHMNFSVKQEKILINDLKNLVVHGFIRVSIAILIMMSQQQNGWMKYLLNSLVRGKRE